MIRIGMPGFLWAGAALALLPIALHFVTRRPPERRALPTARFLTPDPRTRLRFRTSPTDRWVLLLRVAFAVLLGAAFAGVTWEPGPAGTARVVLLDAGSGWDDAWPAARSAAREAARRPGTADVARVLVYDGAGGAALRHPDEVDGVRPHPAPATLEDGLRALRRVASEERWLRATALWVTPATWDRWTPGLTYLRPALWPGAIERVEVGTPEMGSASAARSGAGRGTDGRTAAGAAGEGSRVRHVRVDEQPAHDRIRRAVRALGDSVVGVGPAPGRRVDAGRPEVWFARGWSDEEAPGIGDALRGGGVVVRAAPSSVLLPTGPGIRVVAVRDDARPLATAEESGSGCVVRVGAPWPDVASAMEARFPDFVRKLVRGCDRLGGGAPLDEAARQTLTRSDLPAEVPASAVGARGRPLTRWIVGLLCLLLAAEIVTTAGVRQRGGAGRPTESGA